VPSFSDFLATFDPDTRMRGRQFEHFVKWFLKNDPEWATQVDQVWLWNDYPGQWGRDCGIDLVFNDKTGATWAVQAKCYSPEHEITKSDVDKFLSESNRKTINHRLLITTTDRIGANARQVLDGQEKSVVRYHLTHFENAVIDYPDSIERLSTGKRKPPPEARSHQIKAVDNIISGFQKASRGQLIMACGTGKTFVCLWVKEKLKAKRTLVLVPSLGLLSQILNDWTFAAREKFEAICVCSDVTVNRIEDESVSLVSDLPFPVSNDVLEIAHFLGRDNNQVIFSTYQSSPLIAQAQKNTDIPHFDLAIADEAHRCAGKVDSAFGTILDAKLIKSDRRLFATATPRVYRTGLKKAAEEFGVEVIDMSDERSFGERFHTLSFSEAIGRNPNLLTDYRVVIVGVDDGRIKEWIEDRRLVVTDIGLATDARSLAGQIGLLKAIKDWNLRRIISFHGRVKRAQEFSEEISQVTEWLSKDHRPGMNLWADYVSGEMSTISRRQKLRRLRNVGIGEIGLLSNARCLSEGVDVPALDGIAFIDPRSSEIDIIQSVGRAIRLSENKTVGTIVIPVFIEQTDDAETALEASEYKPIWDVLEALKSHDDRLSDELDQLRIDLGAKGKRVIGANELTKIVFDLPTSVDERFAESLRSYLVAKTTESWMFWYGLLQMFVNEHGHCRVPPKHKTGDGYRVGSWVSIQRMAKDRIKPDRRQRLEALPGWSWAVHSDRWEDGFSYLKEFAEREGHCRVPIGYRTDDGYRLGRWVHHRREEKDTMEPDRRQRLEALLGWSWDIHSDQWEEGFFYLREFAEREGHCRVPSRHKTRDGYRLGIWVSTQRKAEDTVDPDRRQRLEALPGWSWDALSDRWEEGFAYLKTFSERKRHCRIPDGYKTDDGYHLGYWIGNQRKAKDTMEPDRRQRLEALPGWSWAVHSDRWEEGFSYLKEFAEREGHCRVPGGYKTEDGYRLGRWLGHQREQKGTVDPDRRQRLEALPGWSWAVHSDRWEEGFSYLKEFAEREGHCRVPYLYKTEDGYRLGRWVQHRREQRDTIDLVRRQRLEALPGWSWDILSDQWEEAFSYLKTFSEREGHCRVPGGYKTEDGYRLGRWTKRQREGKDTIDSARRQRLEALSGWLWAVRSDQWEEGFSYLREFAEREGHCRVPQSYRTEDGYRLGLWVYHRRQNKHEMGVDRRQRLEALPGWIWKIGK
jgi:superfamily II DNA or RNA helicase